MAGVHHCARLGASIDNEADSGTGGEDCVGPEYIFRRQGFDGGNLDHWDIVDRARWGSVNREGTNKGMDILDWCVGCNRALQTETKVEPYN